MAAGGCSCSCRPRGTPVPHTDDDNDDNHDREERAREREKQHTSIGCSSDLSLRPHAMPRTLLGASSTSLPSLLTGGGGVTPKLQLRHTHTSAQPDQPVVDVPPRHAPLSLPEAADATSAWSMSQQAASQQRRRERQQQQLQMHHHQQDRTSQPAPVVGDDADDGHLPLDEDDDEDLQPFKPPTQVDSPEPIRGDTMKRTPIATHQQVQQAHSQQMQSHATHTAPSSSFVSSSAASLMRGPSFGTNRPPSQPLGGALSYTSTYSTSGSQHMSESLTTSASQSQSQFYSQSRTSDSLSQSLSFSQSLSLSQSRSSPILPPLTSSMASSSTMTDGRSGTSIGVHSSDPGASMVAFHPPPPKLPQLPSRLIAEASSRVQQAEAKKRKNAAQKSGANLLQVKSTSTATTFDALMQQQQQHPGDTQSRIPFVQQKSSIPHSMRAQLPPTHSQQASALHPGAFGSGHRDATASSARPDSSSSFAASPLQHPTTVMGLNTAPPPATAAPMSSHPALAPRTGQPAGRTRLMAEAREKRFESYSLHYPRLQSVTSRDDLERLQLSCDVLKIILQSNGVAIGNKRKEECFDNVWTIIRSKGLKPPTREKTRRPRLDAIAAFATQAAETYEEEEHDDRMDDSRIAYSQPIEGEPAVKRVRANQTPLAHLPPHSSQRTFDFRQPMDTAASTSAATAATALGLSHTPPFSTMAHGPSSARALFDLHARSGSSLSPPPPWVAAPPVFLPAPRYFRMTQPTSTFPLGVGAELVVIVQEYLQFQAVHRFSIDALASFTSARFSLVSGTTQSLLEIARGTGLVRAKLMSFVPVLQSDYLSERRKTRSEWNACYAGDPPSPWCVLTCRVEPEAGHAATSTPTLFTLYYHDAHWRSTGSRVTHTGWRVDGVTGLRHLATQNAAHFLVEAEMFDATWQQTWSIKQIVCMKMMHQRIARDDEATSAAAAAATSMDNTLHPHLTREVVNRIGCIIDIRVQAVEPSQTEYFSRSPYRCLHVMWMKHADATDEEDAAGAYATDLVSPQSRVTIELQ